MTNPTLSHCEATAFYDRFGAKQGKQGWYEDVRQAPNGFERYRDKGELVSANLMKAFRQRDLFPTTDHMIYSFRHAFEDRMLEADVDYGMRCYLMGHKNTRPDYGKNGSLTYRRGELQKIAHPFPPTLFAK